MSRPLIVAFALGAVCFVLLMAEGATRILDWISPPLARTWQEHRLAVPAPYRNAPYEIAEMVAENQQLKWRTADTFGWLPLDQQGRYINITNGMRHTSDAPPSPEHTVWVFGGSTVMGVEVPDQYTMPSYLQRELNTKTNGRYRVVNLGATTVSTRHQLWRLKNANVKTGDIVIFFDGVNDIIQSLYFKRPAGAMVDENRKTIQEWGFFKKAIFKIHNMYSEKSSFVRRFLNPISPQRRPVNLSVDQIDDARNEYRNNIEAAAKFSSEKGVRFVHFLQPSLYSVSKLSEDEEKLLANGWLYPVELKEVYAAGLPAFRRVIDEVRSAGVKSHDITNAFDGRQEEIFLDYCHVNHHGNRLLATAIAKNLSL